MANFWEHRERQNAEWEKYSHSPANIPLRRLSMLSIAAGAIMLVCAFFITIFSESPSSVKIILILRACAGICVSIEIITIMILAYRVNKSAINDRWKIKDKNTGE
ncbi:MAG: hypothetical protein K2J48_09710 [Muribaculaceae bacterium]|nr:hypothetical protein [Muribaculaceae bacterium]